MPSSRRGGKAAGLAAALLLVAAAGCNLILGNKEAPYVDGGAATCDPSTDYSSDMHNCGACGHDCLGGSCSAGVCQPVAIAAAETACVQALATDDPFGSVDNPSLYWVDACPGAAPRIMRCTQPPACSRLTKVGNPGGTVSALAVSAGSQGWVFWADDGASGQIAYCLKSGCPPSALVVQSGLTGVQGLSVNMSTVYWTLDSATGGLGYADINSGPAGSIPNRAYASVSKTDGTWVAWVEAAGAFYCPFAQACPSPLQVAPVAPKTFDVALWGGQTLFWTDTNGVHGCSPLCNVGGEIHLSTDNMPSDVVVDDTNVYWLEGSSSVPNELLRCPVAGCGSAGPEHVGTGVMPGFVVDHSAIYWRNVPSPGITMLAK